MTAAYLTGLGGPEQLTVGPLPVPQPGPPQVLVSVEAVAANTLIRSGAYRTPTPFPFVVGRDLVGTGLYPLPPGNDPVTTVAVAHNAATAPVRP